MNKKDNVAMVPKYRFPEFSESWDIIPILNIGDVYKGGIFSKSDIDQNASIPCIHYGELFTKYNEVISIIYSKTNKKEGFKSKIGDILMPSSDVTPDGLAKASAIMLEDVILGGDMNIIRPNKKFNSIFISYLLNKSKKEIIKLVSGTTIKHIYPCQIITCQLPIANNSKEQQKIADCLFSIDKLISAEEKKLSLLNDYKKGWMQKLFPAEGKTIPEWRFPEFKDRGEWTSDLIANVISAIRPPKKLSTFEYKMIGRYPIVDQGQDEFCGWTDERSSLVDFDNKVLIFGDHTCVVKLVDRPFAQGADGIKIISTKKKISVDFLFQYLCNSPIISISYKRHFSELKEKTILFPDLDSGEQEKISRFLFSIDILIKKEKNKITELKQHKKALMQGLFPTVEEVL